MITTPTFRAHLAQFQAVIESLIETPEGIATAETGFIKRRDHLAELDRVRYEVTLELNQAWEKQRLASYWRGYGEANIKAERLAKKNRSLRGRLGAATQKIKALEAAELDRALTELAE